ncbi:MAG: PUR family DNA/RNA-binding protein [Bacteroidaceae bacterium]|nr:PUR family DNA/RNA-binding protein [Bacteroidaceae bacterium]
MEEFRKKTADEIEKDVIFSHAIKAGKRIYYMDVRKTRKDEMYLSITESKKIVSGEGDDQQVSFEKHKIFLYREDFGNFIDGLTKTIKFIHEAEKASPGVSGGVSVGADEPAVEASDENAGDGASDFKIEF